MLIIICSPCERELLVGVLLGLPVGRITALMLTCDTSNNTVHDALKGDRECHVPEWTFRAGQQLCYRRINSKNSQIRPALPLST